MRSDVRFWVSPPSRVPESPSFNLSAFAHFAEDARRASGVGCQISLLKIGVVLHVSQHWNKRGGEYAADITQQIYSKHCRPNHFTP